MSAEARKPMPRMEERTCKWCKTKFQARSADVKRGWALFCSKSCKAMKQEKRTGQHRAFQERQSDDHDRAMESSTAGWDEGGWRNQGSDSDDPSWDAHKGSF